MTYSTAFLVAYGLVMNLAVMAAVVGVLWIALGRACVPGGTRVRITLTSAAVLLGWYGVITALAARGVFAPGAGGNVALLPIAVMVPIAIGLWLVLRSETLKAAIRAVPLEWLVGIQAYRVIGFVMLLVWGSGQMPGEFAVPAGGGDVLVGLLAIAVAWAVARGFKGARVAAYVWNYVGILDFAVGMAAGFLSSPGPLQRLALDHPNVMVSAYPMVMFPVFAIPISSVLHGICLWRLNRERGVQERSSGQVYFEAKPV